MDNLRSHYRILHHANPDREPVCALVEVLYNDDGTIAKTMEPLFVATTPDEILHDLGAALAQAACCPLIQPGDVVGYRDAQEIPF